MRFALNGTTGLLGRNLLFEILKQNIDNLNSIEIIILGKGDDNQTLQQRMEEIILNDGFDYLRIDKSDVSIFQEINSIIKYLNFDLTLPDLGISTEDMAYLKNVDIDYFYHIAALTNFFDTPEIREVLTNINYLGTRNIISLTKKININNFIYIGTVYHAGVNDSVIPLGYFNASNKFRNPYENTKLLAEKQVSHDISNFKSFRTSTLSGRLIEKQIGSVSKYDVFYEWAKFFLRNKIKKLRLKENFFSELYEIDLRIQIHPDSTMNIMPTDYAAKLLYFTSISDLKDQYFHLVNEMDIPTKTALKVIMEKLNINGYNIVSEEPKDKNSFEKMYYRTVGKIFTPYIIDPPIKYNNDNIQEVIKNNNIECPLMTEENFAKLIDYAVEHNFGLKD